MQSLRERRESSGLSLEDVASALGVSANTVRNWEAGRTVPAPKVTELERYAEVYDCGVLQFIGLVEETLARKNSKHEVKT